MEIISYIGTVVLLSLSGVLMPGPVTAVTVARGAKSPHAGAWVAIGHGLIELPLMALVYFGVGALFQLAPVKIGIGLAGGSILFWMGVGMLRDFDQVDEIAEQSSSKLRSPLLAGALLSLSNPYFLLFWATAGAMLVRESLAFGAIGFVMLAAIHWSCDLVWYYFLSAISYSGGKFFGKALQQGVFILCGLFLLYFCGYFGAGAVFEIVL